ncbi:hypothetical protein [Streptomyces mirabilis]
MRTASSFQALQARTGQLLGREPNGTFILQRPDTERIIKFRPS